MPTVQEQDPNLTNPYPLRRKTALPRTAEHEHRDENVHAAQRYLRPVKEEIDQKVPLLKFTLYL